MSDILVSDHAYQLSSLGSIRARLYALGGVLQGSSQACVVDLTPPVFAGIQSATVQSRGQIRASWLTAVDANLPIRYEIYVQELTATGLFNSGNMVAITTALQYDVFALRDGSLLQNGSTYYVGVRALDGSNNRDNNTVSLSVISTGVSVAADQYLAEGAFAINAQNQMQGTIWCLKNSSLMTAAGPARFQVYDKTGAAVAGMSGSGIICDVNGQFKITPVASTLNATLDHYMVKVTVRADGVDRDGYVALIEPVPEYEVNGVFSLDTSNQLSATFWTTANEEAVTNVARLGTASYSIYDKTGALVAGMTESGIASDANGLFKITPVASTLITDLAHYSVRVTVQVDGVNRTNYLPISGKTPSYEMRGAFSLNTSNQLQGTMWAVRDSGLVTGASLGTASYQVYDRSGAAVVGMNGSGIAADVNGQYKLTPVASLMSQELNHYLIKISATVDGAIRSDYVSVIESIPKYDVAGVVSINTLHQFAASFWGIENGASVTNLARLGTASYEIYDKTGTLVPGMSESGIAPTASGLFVATPVLSVLQTKSSHYSVKATITIDGLPRTQYLPIANRTPSYESRGQFSINALNQFQATLWGTADNEIVAGAALGTASYTVYDTSGSPVAGLTQSGIVADANGRFQITPVGAALLTDLTHYSVSISIVMDAVTRTSFRGFTLLGT